jgi:hypothetical protein
MEGIPGRSIRLIFTEGRTKRSWQVEKSAPRESAEQGARKQQGCQRYGSIGSARKKHAARQPEKAHRSGFGVVKRQFTGLLVAGASPSAKGEA